MIAADTRVKLDRADYYELQTLQLRVHLAETSLAAAKAAFQQKFNGLAQSHQFDVSENWLMDDAACSLVVRG